MVQTKEDVKAYDRQYYWENHEKCKAASREYRRKNRQKVNQRVRERRAEVKGEILRGRSCSRCGENHPAVLDFHHRDPNQKKDTIAAMLCEAKHPSVILAEAQKCDVLCANCHRKLHAGEHHGQEDRPSQAFGHTYLQQIARAWPL